MSNGYLTTHVLDIYNGTPGKGIKGSIFIIENENKKKIKDFELNNDGRAETPILAKDEFKIGIVGLTDNSKQNAEFTFSDPIVAGNNILKKLSKKIST